MWRKQISMSVIKADLNEWFNQITVNVISDNHAYDVTKSEWMWCKQIFMNAM